MNPFLTRSGRLVLLSAVAFMVVGIATSSPAFLLLGQAQVVLIVVAFLLAAPAALLIDRRLVSLEVEPEVERATGTGHIVGDEVQVSLHVTNATDHALHNFHAQPFASSPLEVDALRAATVIRGGSTVISVLNARAPRSGRWMLHGFDVSVTDPLGLVETRDYLPANHAFEFYPSAGRLRRGGRRRPPRAYVGGGLHVLESMGSGTEIRQLRDFRSGDSLRDVAWKASLRSRRLIAREFEREVTTSVSIALDISSSMRGGHYPGQKLEWGIHYTVDLADFLLRKRDRVGLVTFDEKMYGSVAPGNSTHQMRKILHHLVGLNSVVDPELTELDENELERLAADYLLVQERLDFRRGKDLAPSGVNRRLMERWIASVDSASRKKFSSPALREGVVTSDTNALRDFLRLRGVPLPYRVEARLGMKERGLVQALERVVRDAREARTIVVVSDLCGVMNVESLVRGVNLVRAEGHDIEFVVPFTPWFYEATPEQPKLDIVRELFTSAEAEERSRVVSRLRSLGVNVQMERPRPERVARQLT